MAPPPAGAGWARQHVPLDTFLHGNPCGRAQRVYAGRTTSEWMISACLLSCGLCPRKRTRASCEYCLPSRRACTGRRSRSASTSAVRTSTCCSHPPGPSTGGPSASGRMCWCKTLRKRGYRRRWRGRGMLRPGPQEAQPHRRHHRTGRDYLGAARRLPRGPVRGTGGGRETVARGRQRVGPSPTVSLRVRPSGR